MANKTKDPSVRVQFAGKMRTLRWDYNTIAELQDFGFDFTDGSAAPHLEALQRYLDSMKPREEGEPPRPPQKKPMKLMRAMACAALNSGADDGESFTPMQLGRILTEEGAESSLISKVFEVMAASVDAPTEDQPPPLAETPAATSE